MIVSDAAARRVRPAVTTAEMTDVMTAEMIDAMTGTDGIMMAADADNK